MVILHHGAQGDCAMASRKSGNSSSSNLPPREYYRLDQAAEELGCSVDDLIHWGGCEFIELTTTLQNAPLRGVFGVFLSLDEISTITETDVIEELLEQNHDALRYLEENPNIANNEVARRIFIITTALISSDRLSMGSNTERDEHGAIGVIQTSDHSGPSFRPFGRDQKVLEFSSYSLDDILTNKFKGLGVSGRFSLEEGYAHEENEDILLLYNGLYPVSPQILKNIEAKSSSNLKTPDGPVYFDDAYDLGSIMFDLEIKNIEDSILTEHNLFIRPTVLQKLKNGAWGQNTVFAKQKQGDIQHFKDEQPIHGNTLNNKKRREKVIYAAMRCKMDYPSECGNIAKLVEAICNHSYEFWPELADKPQTTILSSEVMYKLLTSIASGKNTHYEYLIPFFSD